MKYELSLKPVEKSRERGVRGCINSASLKSGREFVVLTVSILSVGFMTSDLIVVLCSLLKLSHMLLKTLQLRNYGLTTSTKLSNALLPHGHEHYLWAHIPVSIWSALHQHSNYWSSSFVSLGTLV